MRDFEGTLETARTDIDIKKIKTWMFQEQVKIQTQKEELELLSQSLMEEKRLLRAEKKSWKQKQELEAKRFEDNELLIHKKLKMLEDAFQQLAVDRKMLECERLNFEYEKNSYAKHKRVSKVITFEPNELGDSLFFGGVDNQLALRKRYKELMKIYHPDNRCGDAKTLQKIQTEYEKIKTEYYEV